jgi:hypothetical protein
MTTIIFPVDKSTDFLNQIVENLNNSVVEFDLIKIFPTNESYDSAVKKIIEIKDDELIIFLGHGSPEMLYGGESDEFDKKAFVKLKTMYLFKNKNLFLLACDSTSLLKSSFKIAEIKKSIGFGPLPTDMSELNSNKFKSLGANEETIRLFKDKIVNLISNSLIYYLNNSSKTKNMIDLKEYLILLINKDISETILIKKNRPLADLLFYMRTDLNLY